MVIVDASAFGYSSGSNAGNHIVMVMMMMMMRRRFGLCAVKCCDYITNSDFSVNPMICFLPLALALSTHNCVYFYLVPEVWE